MELTELLSFFVGALVGGGFLATGIMIGIFLDSGGFRKAPKEVEYDPDDTPMDDDFFARATLSPDEGGHEFPTDEILERLHRHSEYEVTDA